MELLNKDGEFRTSKYLEWGYGSIGSYCAWNSMTDLLATASKNTKARIWDINAGVPRSSTILNHALTIDGTLLEKPVSSVDWNFDGTLLATGSMDGFTRIWTTYGRLIRIFGHTSKTIFYVRWNKRSNYILTAGPDIVCIHCSFNKLQLCRVA
ncbi:hypothetical protein C0J52_27953 [Blattella germanica]|nr:hypothetical protein C0J52_27953 [Blattella germanica]